MANCFNHEEREAAARCAVCGKGVCEECVIREGSYAFCSAECREKGAAGTGRSDEVLSEKAKTNSSTLVRKLIYLFVVIAAVAAAYHFYAKNKSTIDRKVNTSVKQVQKEASAIVKDAKKSVPTSSKLKRQKENLVK